jgi:hypothetical protein
MAHALQGTTNDPEPPDAKRRRTSAATLVLRDGVSARIELLYPRVRCHDDIAGIKGDMADLGFAVIESILTADEVEAFQAAFWRAVTSRCPSLKRDDRSTWTSENCEWKGTFGAGQYKHYGMAQEEHCWLIRRNPTIRRVFEEAVYAIADKPSHICGGAGRLCAGACRTCAGPAIGMARNAASPSTEPPRCSVSRASRYPTMRSISVRADVLSRRPESVETTAARRPLPRTGRVRSRIRAGAARPHLPRDWAHPRRICTRDWAQT